MKKLTTSFLFKNFATLNLPTNYATKKDDINILEKIIFFDFSVAVLSIEKSTF